MELCSAWPGRIAAHMEVCRVCYGDPTPVRTALPFYTPSTAPAVTPREGEDAESSWQAKHCTREETLLVMLADKVEATAAVQDAFLTRWGVQDAWDHTSALQGRSWWVKGGIVALLPSEAATSVVEPFLTLELSRMGNTCPPLPRDYQKCRDSSRVLEGALTHALLERELTDCLRLYLRSEVDHRIEARALHRMTAVVPPAMALFLRAVQSSVLHDCLLYHTVDCPLFAVEGGGYNAAQSAVDRATSVVTPATSANAFVPPLNSGRSSADLLELQYRVADDETARLAGLFHEYDLLLSGNGYVRVPLAPVSRYVFTQLLCQSELPSALMLPFMRQHADLTCTAVDTDHRIDSAAMPTRSSLPTEEEVVLGMKVTWAVERWTAALRRGAAAASLVGLPTWNEERSLRKAELCSWIQELVRGAKREAEEFSSIDDAADMGASGREEVRVASTVSARPAGSGNTADSLRRCRSAALQQLEQRLFVPFPSSYRGSSLEWLGQALREVAREHVHAASNMVPRDDLRASWTGPTTVPHRAPSPSVFDTTSTESDSDATSGDSRDDAGGVGTPTAKEAENLLVQLTELEVLLQHEPAGQVTVPLTRKGDARRAESHRSACDSVTVDQERDVMPWLLADDMPQVTCNELFLQHVQLLESEMEQYH
ncbi:conserved hypothetical protein [Leishmania braziliensis MHOM/BR/75/M2904]|uniref:Uncharacterized protein n=2 Tax=Leishmania braziliensis TaxID=5660 RepID=A4HIE8_LEIBR|nr:conserved hypothetical protein [Leishmania braziliensis MHOM/BR/75/M2904]CAJ2477290.1 unnamed protein product [Leishmania braziliensis]CAM40360.2 conserved hypothetical protein [Leishmania braziliensis MHOM/BR/75/M2904]